MQSYQTMLEFGLYPEGKVVLGSFATYSRYAGPREAVFTALCRKNMGCSHFIVGRDHTGVGSVYAREANTKLFGEIGDLGSRVFLQNPMPDGVDQMGFADADRSIDEKRVVEFAGLGGDSQSRRKSGW